MDTSIIYNDFSDRLYQFIFSKVKDEAIAKDLLQEVFIKIHLKKDTLKEKDKLKPWLFRIANNTILDYFRKNKSRNTSSEIDILAEEESDSHTIQDCLQPLIDKLPDTYKEAVYLSDIKGMKQAAIAEKLGISVSGTKSRIQRGRLRLRDGFIACCDYKINEQGFLVGEHKEKKDCKVCN